MQHDALASPTATAPGAPAPGAPRRHPMETTTLFDLLPVHGKVVTLDADLPMKHALDALASHSATCLPVWDSYQQRFVDVFTCHDLVDIVLFTHRALADNAAGGAAAASGGPGEAQQAIERCQLRALHGLKRSKPSGFVMASVDDSLYQGCLLLKQHGLECLPLGDTSASGGAPSPCLLHIMLPEQLLAFIVSNPELQNSAPQVFAAPLEQAVLPHCATPTPTVGKDASLSEALVLLSERRLAALPVVDGAGSLLDVLSCRDVRWLASNSHTDDLSTRLEASLASLPPLPARLHTCAPTDSLGSAIQRLANPEVAQLVCVEPGGAVRGVITSTDILGCFITQPGASPPN